MRIRARRSASQVRCGEGNALATDASEEGGKHGKKEGDTAVETAGPSEQEAVEPHVQPQRSNLACMLHSRECALEGV